MEVISLGGFTVYGYDRVDICSNPVCLSLTKFLFIPGPSYLPLDTGSHLCETHLGIIYVLPFQQLMPNIPYHFSFHKVHYLRAIKPH